MANSARGLVSLRLKKNTLCGRGLNYYSTATGLTKLDNIELIVCFLQNLDENERSGFLLDNQYCRRDVTCKPAIASKTIYFPPLGTKIKLCTENIHTHPPPPPPPKEGNEGNISIVFPPPPPPPPPPHCYCFPQKAKEAKIRPKRPNSRRETIKMWWRWWWWWWRENNRNVVVVVVVEGKQ